MAEMTHKQARELALAVKFGDTSAKARPDFIERLCNYILSLEREPVKRDERQKVVAKWCSDAFGVDHAASIPQRGIRLAEESIEAAQAAGCDSAMIHRLIDHIYSKPPGSLHQEIGGVGVTLLALCGAANLSADGEESRELARVLAKPLSHFAARNKAKNDAGFNVISPLDWTGERKEGGK